MENEVMAMSASDARKAASDYLTAMGCNITAAQKDMFLNIASSFGLNPFKREIYCIPYGDKVSIVTGYETYIKRAERTGKLDGWHVDTIGSASGGTLQATITINRKDWAHPFTHTVLYTEIAGKSPLWQRAPVFMTKKVAIGQGFRLCFPDELGGMPYTADEITEPVRDITPKAEALPSANNRQEADASDDMETLKMLLEIHENALSKEAKDVITNTLLGNGDVKDTIARTKTYLKKRGIDA